MAIENRSKVEGKIIYSDDYLKVVVMDKKGHGGANHLYHVYPINADIDTDIPQNVIEFQKGPIQENGVNGNTHEALLAICLHRLHCFQDGPYPSLYNENACKGIDFALGNLEMRTLDRKNRGVEGKSEK